VETESPLATCLCNNCSGHIQFEVIQAGQTIECPHCKLETLLYVPHGAAPTPKQQNRSKFYIGLSVLLVLIVMVCLIFRMRSKSKDNFVETKSVPQIPEVVPDSTIKPIPASEQPANQAAEAQRRIDEGVRRAIEHYNSASEVAYRREIETKEHFQHLERMDAIKRGATDLELEVMKLRQQEVIQFMENAHAVKEAEWQRQEHERR
jgi:hypothetical protein